jgi:uncharacterized membrane protein YkvA (DUF1232 family)
MAQGKPTFTPSNKRRGRLAAAARVLREARRPGTPGVGARIAAVPRMIGATLSGKYPGLSRAKLLLLGAGVGYIVSPIDVVPEAFLLLLGTVDDVGVAVWLATALLVETDAFLAWERDNRTVEGEPPQHIRSERLR